MNNILKKAGVVLAATGLVIGLSGCAAGITVENANGQGSCGSDPVSISTSQNTSGDSITIDYSGPSATTLFLGEGIYSQSMINPDISTNAWVFSSGHNGDPDPGTAADLLVLHPQTSPGWVHTTPSGVDHFSFTGSIQDILASENATFFDLPGDSVLNDVLPAMVGVHCNVGSESFPTGILTFDNVDSNSNTVSDLTFTSAAALYPNHVSIDPLEVENQNTASNGTEVSGNFHFASGTAGRFGNFTPAQANGTFLVSDNPEIANDSFENLWMQLLQGSNSDNPYFNLTSAPTVDGSSVGFSFQSFNSDPIPDGNYLMMMMITDCTESDPSLCGSGAINKVVFTGIHYSRDGGIQIVDPTNLVSTPKKHKKTLANTGSNDFQGLFGGALALVGASIVLVARRRGKNA
ncbi:MAG: hypothetical protein RL556_406 [Actinomycetota bacterium]|jgi:LPXTG-motif cell wall-anchored protein